VRLDQQSCRERLAAARVAYLATAGRDLWPHVVPVTFAVVDNQLVTGVDQKPKSTTSLRRLRNIGENPLVSVLCDRYEDDWTRLWWVRAAGHARIVSEGDTRDSATVLLRAKYPQYKDDPPQGPIIVVAIDSWSGWSFSL